MDYYFTCVCETQIYFNQVILNLNCCQGKETEIHEHNQSYEFNKTFA